MRRGDEPCTRLGDSTAALEMSDTGGSRAEPELGLTRQPLNMYVLLDMSGGTTHRLGGCRLGTTRVRAEAYERSAVFKFALCVACVEADTVAVVVAVVELSRCEQQDRVLLPARGARLPTASKALFLSRWAGFDMGMRITIMNPSSQPGTSPVGNERKQKSTCQTSIDTHPAHAPEGRPRTGQRSSSATTGVARKPSLYSKPSPKQEASRRLCRHCERTGRFHSRVSRIYTHQPGRTL